MSYYRIVPRDLFNESKLLKCLGKVAIVCHDEMLPGLRMVVDDGSPFVIDQRTSDGGLYVERGIHFDGYGYPLDLYTAYNSKENYPLLCDTDEGTIEVLDDDGCITVAFRNFIKKLKKQ